MGSKGVATPMTWREICRSDAYRGRWVALDKVRYDQIRSQPIEAEVVDADEDLGALCTRIRESDRTACAILFCEDEPFDRQPAVRRSPAPPPRFAHR